MKVLLVTMPWASLHRPSLALSVLAASVKRCRQPHEIEQMYANMRWADFLMSETEGRVTPDQVTRISDGYFVGAGEWVFANALYDVPEWRSERFCRHASSEGMDEAVLMTMHHAAPVFVRQLAEEIVSQDWDVVGFSTTFLQNVPSLALAREVKKAAPEKIILFGGGNCDGVQGEALHRNFPFVDIVVRGEGEEAFVELLDALAAGEDLGRIGGLCWRADDGTPIVNQRPVSPVRIQEVPAPDHDAFFDAFGRSGLERWVEPELILEASRGCWWGAKHQCTFCGLNGSFLDYRSKRPDAFLEELVTAVSRYRVLDVSLADNILDMTYFQTLLPKLAELDLDLRIFCEIKANLTAEQVSKLRAAGVVIVQPGIENLNSRVLRLMDKGVTGVQNVRLLRNCASEGVTVAWNYLYGFPGEAEEDYASISEQFPALVHLQPPAAAYRVALERFSPYFERPELGLTNKGPAHIYSLIYDLLVEELHDLVYLFDSPTCGLQGAAEEALLASVRDWREAHESSTLHYRLEGQDVRIFDRRSKWPRRDHVLKQGGPAEAYLTLMNGYTLPSLEKKLAEQGLVIGAGEAERWLGDWVKDGLVFAEDGRYVALATESVPSALERVYEREEAGQPL